MQSCQRIIIVSIIIMMLIGTVLILIFGGNFFWILFFYFIIGIPGAYLYSAFFPKAKLQSLTSQKTPPPKSSEPFDPKLENRVLFTLKKAGPLGITSNVLVINEKSVTVMYKTFFYSVWEDTFSIKSLTGVYISTTLTSAALTITRKEPAKEYEFRGLNKEAALKAKEIFDGLLLVKENLIKIPKDLSAKEEREVLAEAGQEQDIKEEMNK